MKTLAAASVVATLVALTVVSLLAPAWALVLLAVVALVVMRSRRGFLAFSASTLAINVLIVAWFLPGDPAHIWRLGFVQLGRDGALAGLVGGLRLVSLLGCNLALLSRVAPSAVLDGLRLPPRTAGLLAATLIAAHDVGRDFQGILAARRLDGQWPGRWLARLPAAARLLPALLAASLRRAEARRDALQLAGHAVGPWFAPVVAVSALAIAGRLALLALPNIALTYVVVFLGGLLFGTRVALVAALLSMTLTDLLLTGFLPVAFANAPAMALVGAMGGLLRRVDFLGGSRSDRAAGLVMAATAGIVGTAVFSVTSDFLTWLLVPEYAHNVSLLRGLVLAGLTFNVVPALSNAVLFAASVAPVSAAVGALRPAVPRSSASRPR